MTECLFESSTNVTLPERVGTYVTYGWALVPLAPCSKQPDTKLLRELYGTPATRHLRQAPALPMEVEYWFEVKPDINLGVYPNECVALVDIDRLDLLNPEIPTPTAVSGREGGGFHLYLACDQLLPTRKMPWGHLNPSHLVLPGSIHPKTGRMYEWLPGLSPEEVPFMDYREALSLLGLEEW